MSERPSVIPTLESVEREITYHETELKDLRGIRAWLRKRPRRANPQPLLDAIEGDGKDGEKP